MKKNIGIRLLFISLLFFCLGCKKKSKELTTVNFHLYNPVTNEAYAGVKVWVLQEKNTGSGFNTGSETEVVWEGVTDAYGKASYSFKAYNSTKYYYWQDAENSFVQDPALHLLQQPEFLPLNKNEENEVIYKVVKKLNYVRWVKNIVCYDGNDKFRWRRKSLVDIFDDWSQWVPLIGSPSYPDGYYQGCFENIYTHTDTQDIWDVEMEVIKNGVTTLVRDTFYITGQYGTDTLKLFY